MVGITNFIRPKINLPKIKIVTYKFHARRKGYYFLHYLDIAHDFPKSKTFFTLIFSSQILIRYITKVENQMIFLVSNAGFS
jgi:hypothetical protein